MAKRNKRKKRFPLPEMSFYSFWKPEAIPPKENKLAYVNLLPLGSINEVSQRLFRMPHIRGAIHSPALISKMPVIQVLWTCGSGVVLHIRPEYIDGKSDDSKVMMISAASAVSDELFYKLYVLINEHFGLVVFDETQHEFITLADFKKRILS